MTTNFVQTDDTLSAYDYERLADLIGKVSGIKMPPTKIVMLEGRLRRRLRSLGLATFHEYCEHLLANLHTSEFTHFLNCVTTNKTDFFREPKHFDYLVETILPEFEQVGIRSPRVWSSACSTGAEPYTLAMLLAEGVHNRHISDYEILATDLSTDVLEVARKGIYTSDIVSPVPLELRKRYVMSSRSSSDDFVRIHPSLRGKVSFGRMNLMNASYEIGNKLDIIFCRNVLIYFEKENQKAVLQRLCDCLKPNGYLFIGHSETVSGLNLPVKQVASTIFRRIG